MQAHARAILMSLGLALPAVLLAGQASSGCAFKLGDGCVVTLGYEDGCPAMSATASSTGGLGGMGGATSASSSTGSVTSTASSGTGGKPECTATDLSMCVVPPGLCATLGTPKCVSGKCAITWTSGPAPSQKYGSCKKTLCGTNGLSTLINDDTNVYDDGNPCTLESCTNGMPGEVELNTGSTCMTMGTPGYCEKNPNSGLIACLQCDPLAANTCAGSAGTTCASGTCVPLLCANMSKDPGETDMDCGGVGTTGCLPCGTNKMCAFALDCGSRVCAAGKCVAASCTDNVQNLDETDVDCGGSLLGCPRCPASGKCVVSSDCQSGVCLPSTPGQPNKCAAPSCTDGVQNGDEADIDCGGAMSKCPPCAM